MQIEEKNRKKMLIKIAVAVILVGLIRIMFFGGSVEYDYDYETKTDPVDLVDISLGLEEEFNLEDVRITEAEGNVLEVRLITPTDVSKETLTAGTTYILGYLESQVEKSIEKIRIIFTVNYLDAMFIEAEREDIKEWLDEQIDADEFLKKIKIVKFS